MTRLTRLGVSFVLTALLVTVGYQLIPLVAAEFKARLSWLEISIAFVVILTVLDVALGVMTRHRRAENYH